MRHHEFDRVVASLYDERARLQTADRFFHVLSIVICFFEETQAADLATIDLSLLARMSARQSAVRSLAERLTRQRDA